MNLCLSIPIEFLVENLRKINKSREKRGVVEDLYLNITVRCSWEINGWWRSCANFWFTIPMNSFIEDLSNESLRFVFRVRRDRLLELWIFSVDDEYSARSYLLILIFQPRQVSHRRSWKWTDEDWIWSIENVLPVLQKVENHGTCYLSVFLLSIVVVYLFVYRKSILNSNRSSLIVFIYFSFWSQLLIRWLLIDWCFIGLRLIDWLSIGCLWMWMNMRFISISYDW